MCVIASIPTGNIGITEEKFYNCFNTNSDGFGMMWVDDGAIQMFKTLDLIAAWGKYEEVYEKFNGMSPIILHFRIGTQGPNDLSNCHPFSVDDTTAFCHNGIISQHSVPYSMKHLEKRSDTVLFNEHVLKKLPNGFVANTNTRKLIKDYVGSDKLVFLDVVDGYPSVTTINQDKGVVDETSGIWYSNESFKPYTPKYTVVKTSNNKKEKVYCEGCGNTCFTVNEKKLGVCKSCHGKICECCGIVTTRHNRLELKYNGEKHVLCTDCVDINDELFLGLFEKENSLPEWVKVGEEVGMVMSSTMTQDWYFIEEITDNDIVVRRYSSYESRNNHRIQYSINKFFQYFEAIAV